MTQLNIGSIQKAFGIKGEVKVFPKTDFVKERFNPGREVRMELNGKIHHFVIQSCRQHQGSLLVKFEGLDSLNDVEFFHKGELYIDESERHPLPKGEYYFSELMGCEVYSNLERIGEVIEMIDNPAHPIMRIQLEDREVLVPFNKVFVAGVFVDIKRIDINWMEGL